MHEDYRNSLLRILLAVSFVFIGSNLALSQNSQNFFDQYINLYYKLIPTILLKTDAYEKSAASMFFCDKFDIEKKLRTDIKAQIIEFIVNGSSDIENDVKYKDIDKKHLTVMLFSNDAAYYAGYMDSMVTLSKMMSSDQKQAMCQIAEGEANGILSVSGK